MKDSTRKIRRALRPVRTTIVGGIVFLVPVAIVSLIIGKVFAVVLKLAQPLGKVIPIESVAGIAVVNVVAGVFLLLLCYLAGTAAKSALGGNVSRFLDSKLDLIVPRYGFVKSVTEELAGDSDKSAFKTVLVTLDDCSQIGFEVERSESGQVAVFMLGSPDPWSGSVICVSQDRVRGLNAGLADVIKSMKRIGKGMTTFVDPVMRDEG